MLLLYPFTSGVGELLFNLSSWATGFYGVEIFFILSGFLIGNIFIKNVVFNCQEQTQKLLISDFWMRRWVRTLPNYFLFLLINFILIPIAPDTAIESHLIVKYLFFAQSIFPHTSSFYGVSWSLAVEEWFYLLLPVLFIGCTIFFRNRAKAFFVAMLLLLLLPTLLKVTYAIGLPLYSELEAVFHYSTFYKLDSIFYGLLLSWLWTREASKKWLIAHKKLLLLLGIGGILSSFVFAFLFVVKPIQNSVLMISFATLTSVSIALFFPFLYEWQVRESRFTKSVTFISLISYSLYLVHVPVINIYKYCSKTFFWQSDFVVSFTAFVILNLTSVFIAFIIYKKFELPVLAYRDRIGKLLADGIRKLDLA
jgi:peptidoglycan/LPS O-acetylase OafA/YrhL